MNLELFVLGTGGMMPLPGRFLTSVLLRREGELFLFDSGEGTQVSLRRLNLKWKKISVIFISHTHPDHVCELPLVIQMIYLSGFDKKLTVYVPEEFVEPFEIYLRSVYLLVERIPYELEIVGYSDGFKYENDFILEAVGNTHLHHYKEWIEKYSMPNLMQCYSFKIKINDIHIFYSGDIGSFDDIKNHLDGNNYVITELTHLNLTEFFEFIPSISVEEYIITHLGNSEDVKRLHIEIKKAGIDNITIAMDGMELPL